MTRAEKNKTAMEIAVEVRMKATEDNWNKTVLFFTNYMKTRIAEEEKGGNTKGKPCKTTKLVKETAYKALIDISKLQILNKPATVEILKKWTSKASSSCGSSITTKIILWY